VSDQTPPPIPGNWAVAHVGNTGAWTIGQVWIDHAAGRMCMLVQAHHCNALGSIHGGAMATFADGQAGAVSDYTAGTSAHTPTVTLTIDYIGSTPEGSWLVMDVTLLRTTRTLIFTQAVLSVDGRTVARSSAIYRNFSGKDAQ